MQGIRNQPSFEGCRTVAQKVAVPHRKYSSSGFDVYAKGVRAEYPEKPTTVETLLRHTPRWTAQGMPYEGLCLSRNALKIDSKNQKKSEKYIIADSC
jgi:hypothetical protein